MRLNLSADLSRIINLARAELQSGQELYIVGGAVRDLLLGRELNDLDFVMSEDPTNLAKQIARKLDSGFFVLDDERKTARIVYKQDGEQVFPLDFVKFTGENLYADLENRDFTINAIAIQVNGLEKLIDPLGGIRDLADGILQTCSKNSLLSDPVRVLRGIRLAMQFNFRYAPGVPLLMKQATQHLAETSSERQRDEFFKILEGPHPAEGMAQCRKFGIFSTLIPLLTDQAEIPASPPHTLPLFDHTIHVIKYLATLMNLIKGNLEDKKDISWWQLSFLSKIGKFADQIKAYLSSQITPGRSKRGLLLFSALLHDVGKPDSLTVGEDGYLHFYGHADVGGNMAWETARHLQLSNAESAWVQQVVRCHMDLLPLLNKDRQPTRLEMYRFFKKVGEAGLAVAFLSLADTLGTYNLNLSKERWDQALNVCEVMFSAWWEDRADVVSPKLLLDGNDLQRRFGLKPGKEIGCLLEKLEEAQAVGTVKTESEAEIFLHKQMKGSNNEGEN